MKEERTCWHCLKQQRLVAHATAAQDQREPEAGDLALCYDCGEWNVFNAEGGLEKPNDDDYDALVGNTEATIVRNGWLTAEMARKEGKPINAAYLQELIERVGKERVFDHIIALGYHPDNLPPMYVWNNAVAEIIIADERKAADDRTR